jgi:hypothetical protein
MDNAVSLCKAKSANSASIAPSYIAAAILTVFAITLAALVLINLKNSDFNAKHLFAQSL